MEKHMEKETKPCYCIDLRRAANYVSSIYDNYLKETGLTVNQYSLLCKLKRLNICSVSELAALANLERTTVVRMLKPLMEQNLIQDLSVSGQRNRQLKLTDKGDKMLKDAESLWNLAQATIENRLGSENLKTLLSILDLLYETSPVLPYEELSY